MDGPFSLEEQVARLQALLEATRHVHSRTSGDSVLSDAARILVQELEVAGAVFLAPVTNEPLGSSGRDLSAASQASRRFPVLARDGALLAELVINVAEGRQLSLYEEDFTEGLILQVAVALENVKYLARNIEWARVQQDLDAARSIQRSLLPKSMPDLEGYSLAARSVACYEVGGDYLDAIGMPDGTHLFIVADVAGKGLASAIMATSFRAAFRSLASQPMSLLQIVERMNQQHWGEGQEARRRYVTAIFARLDTASGSMEVVNAGHNPGILVEPNGAVTLLKASGTPLGLLADATFAVEGVHFAPGCKLLLYTDGLTEVFHEHEEFGSDRLTEAFRSLPTEDAGQMLTSIWGELDQFSTGGPQSDDMTALAICCRALMFEREATSR